MEILHYCLCFFYKLVSSNEVYAIFTSYNKPLIYPYNSTYNIHIKMPNVYYNCDCKFNTIHAYGNHLHFHWKDCGSTSEGK